MSFITHIVTKGSTNVEKLAFAASGGFFLLMLSFLHTFDNFRLENLIYNGDEPYQISFLFYTLVFVLLIYTFEPFERLFQGFVARRARHDYQFSFEEQGKQLKFDIIQEELNVIAKEFTNVTSNTYVLSAILFLTPVIFFFGKNWILTYQYLTIMVILLITMGFLYWRVTKMKNTLYFHVKMVLHGYSQFYQGSGSNGLNLARQSAWTELREKILLENRSLIYEISKELMIYMGIEMESNCSRERYDHFLSEDGAGDYSFFQKLLRPEDPFRWIYYRYTGYYSQYIQERRKFVSKINQIYAEIEKIWPSFISNLKEMQNKMSHYSDHDYRRFILETLLLEITDESFEKRLHRDTFSGEFLNTMQKVTQIDTTQQVKEMLSQQKWGQWWFNLVDDIISIRDLAYHHHQTLNKLKELNQKTLRNLESDVEKLKVPPPFINKVKAYIRSKIHQRA